MSGSREALERLAAAYGVSTSYSDGLGVRRVASDEALVHVLSRLGADLEGPEGAAEAVRVQQASQRRRVVEPVTVLRDGQARQLLVRAKAGVSGSYALSVIREDGGRQQTEGRFQEAAIVSRHEVDGDVLETRALALPEALPHGYHDVSLDGPEGHHRARLITAPREAYRGPASRSFGVFCPTYALRTERSAGIGDLTDLRHLLERVRGQGGSLVGTLPLLASFLDEPLDPSPYAPVSRLFWNELYLDPERLPELPSCAEALDLLRGAARARRLERLEAAEWVDYAAVMAEKRPVLEALARQAFVDGEPPELTAYAEARPRLRDYARFRAAVESHPPTFHRWPERMKQGQLTADDFDPERYRYHLYVQWRTDQQLAEVNVAGGRGESGLYLDMPLGVHPDGFDAWRERGSFIPDTSAGAPPDDFFTKGQSWGFWPLHPEGIRRDGYDYVGACFRAQLGHAEVLRIDHVMWMHRIFCVPNGMEATEGVYVHYRPDELYGVLALESQRARTRVVGEDLGTVPHEVREAMDETAVRRMFVLQYEIRPEREPPVPSPPRAVVASLNTHDMPPFAAFWAEHDVEDRIAMGLLSEDEASGERHGREVLRDALRRLVRDRGEGAESPEQVLAGILSYLAASDAELLLVNLEDLWLETRPQNVPGTGPDERPNWRRRIAFRLEDVFAKPGVRDVLERIARERGRS